MKTWIIRLAAALILLPSTFLAQTISITRDCFRASVSQVMINGHQGSSVNIDQGAPLQISFLATITMDRCGDINPSSLIVGYNAGNGYKGGYCLLMTGGIRFSADDPVTYHVSFLLPSPGTTGTYYLNFGVASSSYTAGTISPSYGDAIGTSLSTNTLMTFHMVTPTVQSPGYWTQSGSSIYYNAGPVGIGTATPTSDYKLSVNGNIRTKKVVVETGWADHVFEEGYPLPSLDSVRAYVLRNGHLPGIPSAAEIEAQGLDVGSVQRDMMAKIEEMTLYLLEMQTENAQLRRRLEMLEGKGDCLKPEENTIEGGKGE
jgi:hypothetical protein